MVQGRDVIVKVKSVLYLRPSTDAETRNYKTQAPDIQTHKINIIERS